MSSLAYAKSWNGYTRPSYTNTSALSGCASASVRHVPGARRNEATASSAVNSAASGAWKEKASARNAAPANNPNAKSLWHTHLSSERTVEKEPPTMDLVDAASPTRREPVTVPAVAKPSTT